MHEPPDFTIVPGPSDAIYAKEVIKEIGRSLIDDPTQAQELARDQDILEALIAPVRRLNPDVLCLIFDFCGEVSWKTPLRISGVSRQWRNIVHATPRAWAFLRVHECKQNQDLINHFFKHSGQRPLHIFLDNHQPLSILSEVTGRLECLSIYRPSQILEIPVFPNLKRLSLRSVTATVRLLDLGVPRFPALRDLICEPDVLRDSFSSHRSMKVTFPPLQVLSIVMEEGTAWLELLMGCRSSLLSLRLHVDEKLPVSQQEVLLPVLKCMQIHIWGYFGDSTLNYLKTPAIETYIESRQRSARVTDTTPIYENVGNITRIRTHHAPNLSKMPLLRELQIEIGLDVSVVLSQLLSNRSLCPSLELIEAKSPVPPFEISLVKVNRERSQPVSIRKVDAWVEALPYQILSSPCGPHMPCSEKN